MTSNDNTSAVLTVTELMARWKYSRRVILDAIRTGKLRAFRIGERSYRVSMSEVNRYELEMRAA